MGHLKIDILPHNSIPPLQLILSRRITESPLSSDHFVITVNVESKNSEPQTSITKFNIIKANWHLFTSNEACEKVIKSKSITIC